MYRRRNKKMHILMGVVIFLTVVAVALLYISGRGKVTEPAPVKYEVRLYKTGEADISFPESYLQSDSEDEAVLDVVPDTMGGTDCIAKGRERAGECLRDGSPV